MHRRAPITGSQSGFSVLQTLIAVAVAAIFATVAVPVYAARAKESVLKENAKTLELELKSHLMEGLDADCRTAGDTDAMERASQLIAQALQDHTDGQWADYVNALDGSRAIVGQTRLPIGANGVPPAVWVTGNQQYSYSAFVASQTTERDLAGTLMVVLINRDGRTSCIELFYVTASGERSPTATVLAI